MKLHRTSKCHSVLSPMRRSLTSASSNRMMLDHRFHSVTFVSISGVIRIILTGTGYSLVNVSVLQLSNSLTLVSRSLSNAKLATLSVFNQHRCLTCFSWISIKESQPQIMLHFSHNFQNPSSFLCHSCLWRQYETSQSGFVKPWLFICHRGDRFLRASVPIRAKTLRDVHDGHSGVVRVRPSEWYRPAASERKQQMFHPRTQQTG